MIDETSASVVIEYGRRESTHIVIKRLRISLSKQQQQQQAK